MYDGVYESENVTDRRKKLGLAADYEKPEGGLRIDSVGEYKRIPRIKPLEGREIRFYEDGIEAVVSQDGEWKTGKVFCNGILVDETRKQIIKFHFDKK